MAGRAENYRLNVVQIPMLRCIGALILCVYVLLYDLMLEPAFSYGRYFQFVAIFAGYAIASWLILRAGYRKVSAIDLALLFLVLDIFVWLLAIYRTGADQSLLFFLCILRVSDQAYTTFKRVAAFAYISLFAYIGFDLYLSMIEGRNLNWNIELLKIAYIYGATMYLALVARPAEALRKQLEDEKLRAEEASQAKSEFLANVSHEIRTPMNAILGMAELSLASNNATPEQKRYLNTMKRSADVLLQIIDDILDLSKIEARKLELHPISFSLRDALNDTLEVLAARAAEKDIELACQVSARSPDAVRGDSTRLRQILMNLVGNAIKFTEKGEVFVRVDVDGEIGKDHALLLHFVVTDTGIGIPLEKQKTIFQSFVQADGSVTKRYGGTGLGLAICSQLVTLMGGRIWVESEVGQGSSFHFVVQMHAEPNLFGETSEKTSVRQQVLRPVRILLAEDNEVNQQVALEFLEMRGHQVRIVPNGVEAVTAMESERFDVVLMDVQMPVMDGLKATEAIREHEKGVGRRTPIIAMTGYAMKGDRQRCLEAGMDDYISKPIRSQELYEVVERFTVVPTRKDALAQLLLDNQ